MYLNPQQREVRGRAQRDKLGKANRMSQKDAGDGGGEARTDAAKQAERGTVRCTVQGKHFGRLSKKDQQIKALRSSERQLEKIRGKAAMRMRLNVRSRTRLRGTARHSLGGG